MFESVMGVTLGVGDGVAPGQVARSGVERIDRIMALERAAARVQAELAEEIAAHAEGAVGSFGERGVAAEVALARGVSTAAVEHQLHAARTLVGEFPRLFDLLHRGEISWAGASAVCRETYGTGAGMRGEIDRRLAAAVEQGAAQRLPLWSTAGTDRSGGSGDLDETDDADEVDELRTICEVVRGVPQWTVLPEVRAAAATTARLAKAARRLVMQLDPAAAEERAARARCERGVQVVPGQDGMSALVADLPTEQAADCWHALDHHARALRAAGDERTISQLMADTLVERVTGISQSVPPPTVGSSSGPVSGLVPGLAPGMVPCTVPGRPPAAQVQVLVKASTLLGCDEDPGEVVGLGPVPASVARRMAAAATSTLRRVVVDEHGRVVTVDRATRRGFDPTAPGTGTGTGAWLHAPADHSVHHLDSDDRFFTGLLRTFAFTRDGSCRMPTCDSATRDGDHIRERARGGRTNSANCQGLSVRCHHLRDLPGWHVHGDGNTTVVWTTPTGHRYTSRPPPIFGWGSDPP